MATKHNLNKIADEIASAAYSKGWNDAIVSIMASVKNVGKRNVVADENTAPTAMRRPRRNSDAHKVLTQIQATPGLTGVELVTVLADAGTPVHERTVRTSLHRLRGKFISQTEERWYPMGD